MVIASESPSSPWWLALALSLIAASAAVIAAVVSGRYAQASKASEAKAQRLRELEQRLSEKKFAMYSQVLTTLGALFGPDKSEKDRASKKLPRDLADFATWVGIYGSDEAVRATRNLMQASYAEAPFKVYLRLYAELLLAARRDIGYPDTDLMAGDLLGIRINDLYTNEEIYWALMAPFEELCSKTGWRAPWLRESANR